MLPNSVLNTALLLRRFREIVAIPGLPTQDKIYKALALLCHDFSVDVVSVYMLRGFGTLELFSLATSHRHQGPRPKIVPREGVMGDVIDQERPIIFEDIFSHSKFKEGWEEGAMSVHGFLGVPIAKAGHVMGLLSLQTLEKRLFVDEDSDILQTFAMIMGEMIGGDQELQKYLRNDTAYTASPNVFQGHALVPGLALGYVFLHHEILEVERVLTDDIPQELQRLFESLHQVHEELEVLQAEINTTQNRESIEILETYRMFSQDRGWLAQIQGAIERGLTAEAAVSQAIRKIRERIQGSKDPYFRDRLWDFEDLTQRLLRILCKKESPASKIAGGIIVVADHLGPAELLDYQKYGLKGLILQQDMALAHVGVVAKSLNIPVLSGVRSILSKVQWGDTIVLNGDKGELLLNPPEDVLHSFEERFRKQGHQSAQIIKLRQLPSVTKDGQNVQLAITAGASLDLKSVYDACVSGVGLYRTEIPFMTQKIFPDVLSQERLYRDVYENVGTHPVIFRTLDVGGDKILPYQKRILEENPAMGWRAIRIGLDRPAYLKEQLRALIRASTGRSLHVMFPMIGQKEEFLKAKDIFYKELGREKSRTGQGPTSVALGSMIELPSAAWMLDDLLLHLDFISVGTNDLFQFFYAVDRSNPWVRGRYDVLSKPFLSVLKHIVTRAKAHQKPVSVCGEMANQPLETLVLLALGYHSFSINPSHLVEIKMMIRALDLQRTAAFLDEILERNPTKIRQEMVAYALDHNIPLGHLK